MIFNAIILCENTMFYTVKSAFRSMRLCWLVSMSSCSYFLKDIQTFVFAAE